MKRDRLLLGLKSRHCPRCRTSRIHSEDGEFCLTCGRINYLPNTFKEEKEIL